jgi:superfamily II DNA or RNA helicase
MSSFQQIAPAEGSWVIRKSGERREARPGHVAKVIRGTDGRISLRVQWLTEREQDVVPLDQVECGLRVGFEVWHAPEMADSALLGLGIVVAERLIGGRKQLLVDFLGAGQRLWMPWERLRFAKGPAFRFGRGDKGGPHAAERFRLRNLANALELWNENTGALSRFDIDPLPHQIHLVHHILASGNLNWLIADDVGLGKTIEAGLLIAALRQRNVARRVLIVVPAGLTRQWQEDLKLKFGLDDFRIYGADFSIDDVGHWKLYDRVIASMDKLKGDGHLDKILAAEPWDLVIFDEAHRLTRKQWGMKFQRSDRYRLAESLRRRTSNFVLLSATPHQGRADQFVALLELLRPEWSDAFENLELDSSILSRMVFRNRKSDVTDIDGNFVFHGQTSRMIQVDSSPELLELERQLHAYLEQGYQAAKAKGGQQANAIGFVMTVYRKLAASSIVTLQKALVRRLARLQSQAVAEVVRQNEIDDRFSGEWEEAHDTGRQEFFVGEIGRLKTLVAECSAAAEEDDKMRAFLEKIIAPILERNADERVLIFTEYRGTQDYIVDMLAERYGAGRVHIVNGSMDVEERRAAIAAFEEDGQFLVSTEAGGEGINLHRRCNILVNFDLPWNPMRLAQRIGRLYRYGQKKHVVAFNLQGIASADELIVSKMYERLEQVAKDMSPVMDSTTEALVSDIVGELASLIDVEDILEDAMRAGVSRTDERIEEALRRAQESSKLQRDLFHHAVSYDSNAMSGAFAVGLDHLRAFLFGMVTALGGSVHESRLHPGRAWRLDLPDAITSVVAGLGREPLVTFDRALPSESAKVLLLDLDHALVRYLLGIATHYDFEGLTAAIAYEEGRYVMTGMLRWQDERGRRMRQEYVALAMDGAAGAITNPASFSAWLLSPASTGGGIEDDRRARDAVQDKADEAMDAALAARSNTSLHPENAEGLTAAWASA